MDLDDLMPRPEPPRPKDLEPMSIEALEDYIAELEAEIGRVRTEIAANTKHRSGAEGLFRK